MNIAEAEVGVLAILNLGDTALAATELGCHLCLSETGGYPGDNKLVDELGLGRKLSNGIGHPAIAMSAEHLVHIAIEWQCALCHFFPVEDDHLDHRL